MSKLTYGKNNQINFDSEAEKQEAIEFLRVRPAKGYIEPNQKSGAWAPEHRFYFRKHEKIPKSLERQLTNGRRINCEELFDEVYGK